MAQVTEHFTLEELTRTSTGFENTPDVRCGANLVILAETILEPIRVLIGVPMSVHSGFRAPKVNHAVGGHPQSAHLEGRACDFRPVGMDIREAYDLVRRSSVPYDKLFLEKRGGAKWIHVQGARNGAEPRRIAAELDVTNG